MTNYTFVINHPVHGLMPVVAINPAHSLRIVGNAVILTAYPTPDEVIDEYWFMLENF